MGMKSHNQREIDRVLSNEYSRKRLLKITSEGIDMLHCQGRGPYIDLRILHRSFEQLVAKQKALVELLEKESKGKKSKSWDRVRTHLHQNGLCSS